MLAMRNKAVSFFGVASLAVLLAGAANAEDRCFPYCDYVHYYGPHDFSYRQPGLFGYPHHCGPQGDCAPDLAYTTGILRPMPTGRITVRLPRAMPPRRP